jgi:hypothetical protein
MPKRPYHFSVRSLYQLGGEPSEEERKEERSSPIDEVATLWEVGTARAVDSWCFVLRVNFNPWNR